MKLLSSSYSTGEFISYALNSLNDLPWRGLVIISAHVLSTGNYSISGSPCATLSDTKKYLVLMCLVRLGMENLPLFSKSMEFLLSCISFFCEILYPCAYINYLEHSILFMASSTLISSSSVELFLSIFFLVEKIHTSPFPRDIMSPVCPWQFSCTAYEGSNHHFTTGMSSTLKVSFSSLVILRYFNTRFSFPQYSSSVFFMGLVRNSTTVCMSWCSPAPMNSSCATLWWKVCTCSSVRYFVLTSSCTVKMWSSSEVAAVVTKCSGNFCSTIYSYSIMDYFTVTCLMYLSSIPK